MEPDEAELPALQKFKEICDWVGINDATRAGVATAFGVADEDRIRALARMPRPDFEAVAALVKISDGTSENPPTPMQQSQIGMIWETIQFAAGVKKLSIVEQREADVKVASERAHQLALATAGVTVFGGSQAAPQTVPLPKAVAGQRMVAYEATVDQSDRKSEVPMLDAVDIQKAYDEYNKKMGSGMAGAEPVVPHPDEEPTGEQLTALKAVATSGAAIYADFAIWKPHANRLKKAILFQGLHIDSSGKVAIAEIKGPASFEEWEACWKIFRVAAIMLSLLSPAASDGYHDHIKRLHMRYGHMAWLLLYQADVRFRSEHVERIRRKGELLLSKARAIGPQASCEYDSAMPWEFVYRTGPDDFNFWQREFEADALLVRAQVDKLGPLLGPDLGALVSGATRSTIPPSASSSASALEVWAPQQQPQPKGRDKGGQGKDRSRSNPERRDSNGMYLTNRKGTPLCAAYQTGDCTEMVRKGGAPVCARDPGRLHQCAKCLGAHPSNPKDGQQCRAPDSNKTIRAKTWKGGRGGGKGRGKY